MKSYKLYLENVLNETSFKVVENFPVNFIYKDGSIFFGNVKIADVVFGGGQPSINFVDTIEVNREDIVEGFIESEIGEEDSSFDFEVEIDLEIENISFTGSFKGARSSLGVPEEPDQTNEVEEFDAYWNGIDVFEANALTERQSRELITRVSEGSL